MKKKKTREGGGGSGGKGGSRRADTNRQPALELSASHVHVHVHTKTHTHSYRRTSTPWDGQRGATCADCVSRRADGGTVLGGTWHARPGGSSPSGDKRGCARTPGDDGWATLKRLVFLLTAPRSGLPFVFLPPPPVAGFRSAADAPDPAAVPRAKRSAGATARPAAAVHRGPPRGALQPRPPHRPPAPGGRARHTTRRSYPFRTSRLRQVWMTYVCHVFAGAKTSWSEMLFPCRFWDSVLLSWHMSSVTTNSSLATSPLSIKMLVVLFLPSYPSWVFWSH